MDFLTAILLFSLITGNTTFNKLNERKIIEPSQKAALSIINNRDLKTELKCLGISILYGLASSLTTHSLKNYLKTDDASDTKKTIDNFISYAGGLSCHTLGIYCRKDLKFDDAFYMYLSYVILLGTNFWPKFFSIFNNNKNDKLDALIRQAKQILKDQNRTEEDLENLIERLSKIEN